MLSQWAFVKCNSDYYVLDKENLYLLHLNRFYSFQLTYILYFVDVREMVCQLVFEAFHSYNISLFLFLKSFFTPVITDGFLFTEFYVIASLLWSPGLF